MPSGFERDIEVLNTITGQDVLNEILSWDEVEIKRPGERYAYRLISKGTGQEIFLKNTLLESGLIKDEETIIIALDLEGGGFSGIMMFELPYLLEIGEDHEYMIRIGKKDLAEQIQKENLGPNTKISEIEINKLMVVNLEENSLKDHLFIKNLSTQEQIINESDFSTWIFHITPLRLGFTSVVLRVTMPEIVEGFGERRRDVFLFNQEVQITKNQNKSYRGYFFKAKEIYEWTEGFRNQIYTHISRNETGLALEYLINFFQKCDLELFNAMILLQAQWNEGRNQNLFNAISLNDWLMIQSRVNYCILELIKNIEHNKLDPLENLPIISGLNDQMSDLFK